MQVHGFGAHGPSFAKQRINGVALIMLTGSDLEFLGVTDPSERAELDYWIEHYHKLFQPPEIVVIAHFDHLSHLVDSSG